MLYIYIYWFIIYVSTYNITDYMSESNKLLLFSIFLRLCSEINAHHRNIIQILAFDQNLNLGAEA